MLFSIIGNAFKNSIDRFNSGALIKGLKGEWTTSKDTTKLDWKPGGPSGKSGGDAGHGAPAKKDDHGPKKDDHGKKDAGHAAPKKDDGHGAPKKDAGHGGDKKAPAGAKPPAHGHH